MKNNQNMVLPQEVKMFEKELTGIIDTNIKDYSSRIAKSVYLEKNIEKKKEKKKDPEAKTITIIGRRGNKFVRKDVHNPLLQNS